MNQILRPEPSSDGVDLAWLPDSIGFLVSMAQVQVYDFFMGDLARYGLRPAEFCALLVIDRNPGIRQGVLGQSLRFKRAHVTKLIRALEDRGLVAREVPDDDRRSVALCLTDQGKAFVRESEAAFHGSDSRRPSHLTAQETERLRGLLQKFVGLAEGQER